MRDKEEKIGLAGWWLWILGLSILTVIILTALSYVGLFGKTTMERVVFENSYQKQAGDQQRLATYRAQLAGIESRLMSNTLSDDERSQLEAQRAMLQVQINAAPK